MHMVENVTTQFVRQSRNILGDNLVGIYLHGSAVMGCFHEKKSDIDLLVVVNADIANAIKRQYMDMVVELNKYAPQKGIEVSIVRKDVCRPFLYPTPFELHFSIAHLQWYQESPADYIAKMHGLDKDLAAHITVIWHRGRCLCGENIRDVFEEPDKAFYFDSIWSDIANAEEEIMRSPVYMILNLCRVLAYKKEGLILSKKEGGNWGIDHIPPQYHSLLSAALKEYASGKPAQWEESSARGYAAYMIGQIDNQYSPTGLLTPESYL
ncbi:MAG: DUF4111 domain-containing protein [Lachnospiraceae bacterium]